MPHISAPATSRRILPRVVLVLLASLVLTGCDPSDTSCDLFGFFCGGGGGTKHNTDNSQGTPQALKRPVIISLTSANQGTANVIWLAGINDARIYNDRNYELHFSKSSAFTPDDQTKKATLLNGELDTSVAGLEGDTTYFVKVLARDKQDNDNIGISDEKEVFISSVKTELNISPNNQVIAISSTNNASGLKAQDDIRTWAVASSQTVTSGDLIVDEQSGLARKVTSVNADGSVETENALLSDAFSSLAFYSSITPFDIQQVSNQNKNLRSSRSNPNQRRTSVSVGRLSLSSRAALLQHRQAPSANPRTNTIQKRFLINAPQTSGNIRPRKTCSQGNCEDGYLIAAFPEVWLLEANSKAQTLEINIDFENPPASYAFEGCRASAGPDSGLSVTTSPHNAAPVSQKIVLSSAPTPKLLSHKPYEIIVECKGHSGRVFGGNEFKLKIKAHVMTKEEIEACKSTGEEGICTTDAINVGIDLEVYETRDGIVHIKGFEHATKLANVINVVPNQKRINPDATLNDLVEGLDRLIDSELVEPTDPQYENIVLAKYLANLELDKWTEDGIERFENAMQGIHDIDEGIKNLIIEDPTSQNQGCDSNPTCIKYASLTGNIRIEPTFLFRGKMDKNKKEMVVGLTAKMDMPKDITLTLGAKDKVDGSFTKEKTLHRLRFIQVIPAGPVPVVVTQIFKIKGILQVEGELEGAAELAFNYNRETHLDIALTRNVAKSCLDHDPTTGKEKTQTTNEEGFGGLVCSKNIVDKGMTLEAIANGSIKATLTLRPEVEVMIWRNVAGIMGMNMSAAANADMKVNGNESVRVNTGDIEVLEDTNYDIDFNAFIAAQFVARADIGIIYHDKEGSERVTGLFWPNTCDDGTGIKFLGIGAGGNCLRHSRAYVPDQDIHDSTYPFRYNIISPPRIGPIENIPNPEAETAGNYVGPGVGGLTFQARITKGDNAFGSDFPLHAPTWSLVKAANEAFYIESYATKSVAEDLETVTLRPSSNLTRGTYTLRLQGYGLHKTVRRYKDIEFDYHPPEHALTAQPILVEEQNGVRISWQAVEGVLTYAIFRDGVFVEQVIGTSFFDPLNRTGNENYTYTIYPTNGQHLGQGQSVSIGSEQPTLPAPTLSAELSADKKTIVLTWQAMGEGAVYHLLRATRDDIAAADPLATSITQITYTDADVADGTTYHYWLKACNAAGCSEASHAVMLYEPVHINACNLPKTNHTLARLLFNLDPLATVYDNPGAVTAPYLMAGYEAYIPSMEAHAGVDFRTKDGTNAARHPIYSVVSGEVVRAENGVGSGAVGIKTHTPEEQPVLVFYAHLDSTHLSVGNHIKAGELIGLSGKKGTSDPHLHVEYRVDTPNGTSMMFNTSCGDSDCSTAEIAARTQDPINTLDIYCASSKLPNIAIGTNAPKNAGDTITFTATLSEPLASGYTLQIRLGDNDGGFLQPVAMSPETDGATFTYQAAISQSGARRYQVAIFRNDHVASPWQEGTYIMNPADEPSVLPAPALSTELSADKKAVILTWSQVANAGYYELWRGDSSDSAKAVRIAEPKLGDANYTDRNAAPGKTHHYWAKACNPAYATACSVFSEAASITLPSLATSSTRSTGHLNDTGITWGGNYTSGNNVACTSNIGADQDCQQGRDGLAALASLKKAGGGLGGFDLTKIAKDGTDLAANAKQWHCVRDNHTGFTWEVKTIDGGMHDKDTTYRWGGKTAQGLNHMSKQGDYYDDWTILVNEANSTPLCGLTNWRVPTREELRGIVHYGVTNPAIDAHYFPNTPSAEVWSATPYVSNSNSAWLVKFSYGEDATDARSNAYHVRLVSSGTKVMWDEKPAPKTIVEKQNLNDTGIGWGGNYTSGNNVACTSNMDAAQDCDQGRDGLATSHSLKKAGDGLNGFDLTKIAANGAALPASAQAWRCVRDNYTGITWEVKTTDGGIHDRNNTYQWGGKTAIGREHMGRRGTYYAGWDTLVDGTNDARLCGLSNWRVPTREELRSIVHYGVTNPAIDAHYFPNTPSAEVWSATPYVSNSNSAWLVKFSYGEDATDERSEKHHVRLASFGEPVAWDEQPTPKTAVTEQLLNDTGITWGGNYTSGNNVACTSNMDAAQDCHQGRDSAGQPGFAFTKLSASGDALSDSASLWRCVKDSHTGLVWEVKTTDGGIHDKNNTYQWGGKTAIGLEHMARRGTYYAGWNALVDGSNREKLCGFNNWRVPTREELRSIVHYGVTNPAIDARYFPNTPSAEVWSATPYVSNSNSAWLVKFNYGEDATDERSEEHRVRLVADQ